jgi:hypothetical protein
MGKQSRAETVIDKDGKAHTLAIIADWIDNTTQWGKDEYPSELGRVMILEDGREVELVGDWHRRRYRIVGTDEILQRWEAA